MRIALTLLLLLVVTFTAWADTGRRGRWHRAPLRTWHTFEGYNTRYPGWDSSYYSPYTPGNTTTYGTPTPAAGYGTTGTNIPNAIPNTTWTDGTTPGTTNYPTNTTNPNNAQFYQPIPNVTSDIVSPNTTPSTPTSPTPGNTTRTLNRQKSSSASFQLQTPQTDYWRTIDGSAK